MADREVVKNQKVESMKPFIYEYDTDTAVSKYVKGTAGLGIEYLLYNVYGPIYIRNIKELLEEKRQKEPLRILEFGCGAGMNLLYLLKTLREMNIQVKDAYGTDFSKKMICAANQEAKAQLTQEDLEKCRFAVASNEDLQYELGEEWVVDPNYFDNYFDVILGVNTFRYSWRNEKAEETSHLLYKMLAKGGRVIVIDMNKGFPYYLTKLRSLLSKTSYRNNGDPETVRDPLKTIIRGSNNLPTLQEYVEPFRKVGFEILREEIFSWIAHSSGKLRLTVTKLLIPLLDKMMPDRAMRVLIVGRKPHDT